MREPLLKLHPETRAVSMRDVVGIANAIEQEAFIRYGQLAELMRLRGEPETAQAFARMQAEKRAHIETIAGWAAELGQTVPPAEDFAWRLPPEIADSWNGIARSALLSPYRAFTIAVQNEERAFSLYIYLAAHAEDARAEAQLEKLAAWEMERATRLRRWRRAAYHTEHGGRQAPAIRITSEEELAALVSRRLTDIAVCHRELAERLAQLGDKESAALLVSGLDEPKPSSAPPGLCLEPECRETDVLRLLLAAQKPLERFAEELERILENADPEVAPVAEKELVNIVGRLAALTAHIERLSQSA